ncbi:hypothetical protein C0J52_22180 [Blattella germanica]|nr:hypothetical protein C0J52_22180 [Blattella germanica]
MKQTAAILMVLFALCIASYLAEENMQCTKESDRNTLCVADCLEDQECRCITPPNVRCIKAPCLFATCINKKIKG